MAREPITLFHKPWFVFLLSLSILTAIFLPVADKVGYWTSAFPAALLLALFPTAISAIYARIR